LEGKIVLPSETPAPDLRYGVCTRMVGHGHPVVGTYSSESSSTPSDIGILTSEITSYVVAATTFPGAIGANTAATVINAVARSRILAMDSILLGERRRPRASRAAGPCASASMRAAGLRIPGRRISRETCRYFSRMFLVCWARRRGGARLVCHAAPVW